MHIKGFLRAAAVSSAALLMLTGCTRDISQTLPPEITAESSDTEASSSEQTTTTEASSATSQKTNATLGTSLTTTTTEAPETEISAGEEYTVTDESTGVEEVYREYVLTDKYNEFISQCVFVGDSICSGLKAYSILPASQVLAQGNVAARSIFDYEFKVNGAKMSILAALVDLKPKYVVFSMGMNDVNITSEKTFCDNYGDLLSQTASFLPDATLIVCSVTPVTYSIEGKLFTYNETIDRFNIELKKYLDKTDWIYADIAHEMKNSANMLKSKYLGSEDGVHLAPDAYTAILYQLCERVVDGRIYDPETGRYEDEEEEETSAETTKPADDDANTDVHSEDDGDTPENDDPMSGTVMIDDSD